MSSEAKIAANRRNALKSTGPRTEGGKSRSKLNGVTHTLYATTPVLLGEDRRAYRELELANVLYFAPVGPVENTLVRQITAEQWRLARYDRAEFALSRQVIHAKVAHLFKNLDVKARLYGYSLLDPTVDFEKNEPSPVAAKYVAATETDVKLNGRVDVVDLNAADKKFINERIDDVLDVGNTVLESLVPAGTRGTQEILDRQRRATMRVFLAYVDKLMELQETRLTVALTPSAAVELETAPMTGARRLKSLPANKPANQNDQGSGDEGNEEGANDDCTPRQS